MSCGREVCPPRPWSVTVMWSHAAVSGPSRSPTSPTSRLGSQCTAKTESRPSTAPAVIASWAPPGMTSSAAWKMPRTATPRRTSAGSTALSASRAPSSARGVDVVAAGVADARHRRGELQARALAHRQGVDVGPQPHPEDRLGRTDVGDQTGAGQPAQRDAGELEAAREQIGRARLLAGQLGMGVEVPADVDELCGQRGDALADRGEEGIVVHRVPHCTRRGRDARDRSGTSSCGHGVSCHGRPCTPPSGRRWRPSPPG